MHTLAMHDHQSQQPSAWVARFAGLIPVGEVLDLACGSGRHAKLLAGLGYRVTAVDRDHERLALVAGQKIETLALDLETGRKDSWPFAAGRFAGIIVTNYLHRPLFSSILAALAPGGILIYETFAEGNAQFGKPSNPDFLLKRGELLDIARAASPTPLRILAYEDGFVSRPHPAIVQRICAIKPDSGAERSHPALDLHSVTA